MPFWVAWRNLTQSCWDVKHALVRHIRYTVCTHRRTQYAQDLILSMVSGIYWGVLGPMPPQVRGYCYTCLWLDLVSYQPKKIFIDLSLERFSLISIDTLTLLNLKDRILFDKVTRVRKQIITVSLFIISSFTWDQVYIKLLARFLDTIKALDKCYFY